MNINCDKTYLNTLPDIRIDELISEMKMKVDKKINDYFERKTNIINQILIMNDEELLAVGKQGMKFNEYTPNWFLRWIKYIHIYITTRYLLYFRKYMRPYTIEEIKNTVE